MMKSTTLAERIKIGMAHGGVTSQSDLARKMKVNRQTVNRWYLGEGTKPEPEMLVLLADALKVSIRWLILGAGDMAQERHLTHAELEVLALWKSLPKSAQDHWLSQGRDLATLLGRPTASNPFSPSRK